MTDLRDPADNAPTPVAGAPPAPDPRAMPPWLPRAIGLFMLGIAGLFVLQWLLLRLRTLLILLFVSLFLAIAIEPAVNALARRGWRRGAATAVVFLGLFVAASGFLVAMGSLVVNQFSSLADAVPGYVEETIAFVNRTFGANLSSDTLVAQLSSAESPVRRFATGLAGSALGIGVQLLALVFQLLTVVLFTFYFAADGPRFRRAVLSVLAPRRQREALRAWDVAVGQTGGYVYSRVLLAAASATATGLFLWLIGVPYPVALAIWVGLVSQFVPTVGTYLAGALPVLVALLSDPLDAVWVVAFIVAYQQFENYLLAPRITARTMSLHPAVAFGAVIAGAALLGGVGALLALPVAATLQAFGSTYVRRHEVVEEAGPAITD
jgi:predicted PurR-regulated permease PerM